MRCFKNGTDFSHFPGVLDFHPGKDREKVLNSVIVVD